MNDRGESLSQKDAPLNTSGLGLRQLSQNAAATLGRQVLSSLLGLATTAIVARFYGPAGNGTLAVALLMPTMLTTFLNMGVVPANVYYLGSSQVTVRQLLAANLRIFYALGSVGLMGGGAILTGGASRMFPGVDPLVLWLALGVFPLGLLNAFLLSVFQGLQRFQIFNTIAIGQSLANLVLVGMLAISGRSEIVLLVGVQVLVQLLVLVLSIVLLRPLIEADDRGLKSEGFEKRLIGYGWKAHLSNIVAFINYKADVFLTNLFLGPGAVGVYVIAVALGERLWLISQAVGTVLLPRLSQLSADLEGRKVLTPIVARWVLALTLMAGVVLAAVAKPIIFLVFGQDYAEALLPLWIMVPGFVLASSSQVLANDIAARGRPELNMLTSIVSLVVSVCGNLALIPSLGLRGAALAITLSLFLNMVLKLILYVRLSGNNWRECLIIRMDDLVLLKRALGK